MFSYTTATIFSATFASWLHYGAAQYDSCIAGAVTDIGNGRCDAALNIPSCGFDGGDCCPCTCSDGPDHSCSDSIFDCLYPGCDDPPPTSEDTICNEVWVGDGWCDWESNNHIGCSWDGGDCCEDSCVGNSYYDCGDNGFHCLDPAFSFDPELVAEYPDCPGSWAWIGDGVCDGENNNAACAYDGGDCCFCSCGNAACVDSAFDCLDPTAGDEFYECKDMPPAALPCSAEVQEVWTVENSKEAQALAAAVNCSGGSFEVEWRGQVVVDEPIFVVDGTVLTVRGTDTGAVIDGNTATRLFTVVDAALHLSDVNITSGASMAGGAIAAARSVLTLNRTNFVGNGAEGFGGAVFLSDGSSASCIGGGATFANNKADLRGGGMYVTGSSTVSCGGSWINNTAGVFGGAMDVVNDSSVSWEDATMFSYNAATYGGAFGADSGSSVSWSGVTTFFSNNAKLTGGAGFVYRNSTVSWSGTTTFSNCAAIYGIGGALDVQEAAVSWSGSTEFVANTARSGGGAIFAGNGTTISWTGTTEFTSNTANDGGAVGSRQLDTEHFFVDSLLFMNESTSFSNNSCATNGGALALLGGLSVRIGAAVDVSFVNNTAGSAGGAIYLSDTEVGPIFPGVSFVSNSAQIGGAVSSIASGNKRNSFSHSPTNFERCHFIDNRAATTGGAVESAAGRDQFLSSVFEGNKARIGGALRLSGTATMENCSFADNVSDEGEGTAVSNVGSLLEMRNISFRGNVFHCEPGMFLSYNTTDDPFEAACSGCQAVCDGCSFEDPPLVPICKEELDNTVSAGGTVTLQELSIEPGYWRATESSENVLACFHAAACLGGVTGTAGYCLEGYEGPYCSCCSDGYTPELGFTCTKCSDSAGGVVLAAAVAVVVLIVTAAVFSYLVSGKTGGMRRGVIERLGRYIPLQSVKILVVAWQILTQFSSVANVAYPEIYQRFVDALGVINFDLTWILSIACVVDVDFHDRLLVATIGPIIAMLFLVGTYSIAARINRGAPEALQIVWNKHVSTVLLLTFLVYSSVSSVLYMSYACEILEDGNNYLRADYRIHCDSSKHRGFQVYAGLMIVVYTVGIPAFYSVLLFKDRKTLRNDQADREDNARVKSTSDLWKPYKPSRFYYEVIECGRRVLLAGVVVFIYPNTAAQIAISLLMAFIFAVMSEALAPYASEWDTWLNRIGHAVVYVSMFGALLLKVDVSDEHAKGQKVFGSVLVAAHACLILVVVVETIVLAFANFRDSRVMPRIRKVVPGGSSRWSVTGV